MTYNEWRDELKNNLLCVSESERRRVLDYYAEAYADRREAGFSEREVIEDFGSPYDAAQRILSENKNEGYNEGIDGQNNNGDVRREEHERRRRQHSQQNESGNFAPPPPPPPPQANGAAVATANDNTWLFVLLCIVLAPALFGLFMGMAGITVGFCIAPIAVISTGAALVGSAIGTMVSGEIYYGLFILGGGIITIGVGIILCPIFFKLVKLMWQAIKKFFSWLKAFFSGKESM